MSKLEFLEANSNFISYYRTLRDVNNFLGGTPGLDATNLVITKFIFEFIRINGVNFRDMDPDQYEREYQMFENDFIDVIQNSGENDVDFIRFASLLDEILGIANLRMEALGKIKRNRLGAAVEEEEESSNAVEAASNVTTAVVSVENIQTNSSIDAETIAEITNETTEDENNNESDDNTVESSDRFNTIGSSDESNNEPDESSSESEEYRGFRRYR
ncbi:hypothetical protein ABES02_05595 [Neobacillus pocheonensis]|uniref:hypothetical protein n=1 Tax=Neobacillus pocheonensis TaxID=363869 RepID=UPI003D2D5D20